MLVILELYIYNFDFYQTSTREVLESTIFQYSTLLNTSENIVTLLYSSNDFHLNTLLYSSIEISVLYPTLDSVVVRALACHVRGPGFKSR